MTTPGNPLTTLKDAITHYTTAQQAMKDAAAALTATPGDNPPPYSPVTGETRGPIPPQH